MSDIDTLLGVLLGLERQIRDAVVAACTEQSEAELGAVADDGPGDTIYRIDKISEEVLIETLEARAAALGGILLVAEGIPGGALRLPRGSERTPAWRVIVDPIDGTRGLMYQKRSAWVLAAAAPERGAQTSSADIVAAVQIEIPLVRQHLCDELWAVRGRGAQLRRVDRLTGRVRELAFGPSRASSVHHGFAMLTRFFPGARDELAAIDEEIMLGLLGAAPEGKALCFEDQYASTGGQLYELMIGHDRFNADLRPLMASVLARRGLPRSLCCHPYDLCTALIATEAGVRLADPWGGPLVFPLNVEADVAWVGYANDQIRSGIEPLLGAALARRGLRRAALEQASP
jgi:fructose-1,6-bisphosphatase/inositol monophosphatase family enzyme